MDVKFSTQTNPATPEFVLSVFQDVHRQNFLYLAADSDELENLTFDTTVSDWCDAWEYDLMLTFELGRQLNSWWQVDFTSAEWRQVLKPARERRLEDVCQLIASRTLQHQIRPAFLLGRECREAGAFLTIRSLLAEAGADASKITPSTPLGSFARRYGEVFLGPIATLAPGKLPLATIERPVHDAFGAFGLIGCALVGFAWLLESPELTIAGASLFALSLAGSWFAAYWMPPTKVQFGNLQTFRDLARLLVSARD